MLLEAFFDILPFELVVYGTKIEIFGYVLENTVEIKPYLRNSCRLM
jgi:hypothetical protein